MYKKIVLFALLMIPVTMFAQEIQKNAHINYQEITSVMPEIAQLQDSLKSTAATLEAELTGMKDEYNTKLTDWLEKQNTLAESIKLRRQQELSDYQDRIQNFQEYAGVMLQQLQQTLAAPIQEKVMKAIKDVATENHYTYVFDSVSLLFISPQAIDATPLVKAKLGLK
ncbi:hypothetical protein FACS189426_16930 [Bacteroidia bacterium]|nr:hypothetical protein FACS189426_16930 [Bacteroidia bacterium]